MPNKKKTDPEVEEMLDEKVEEKTEKRAEKDGPFFGKAISENACKTYRGEGKDIVKKQNEKRDSHRTHIGIGIRKEKTRYGFKADRHLQKGIDERRTETPSGSVKIGNDHKGQKACQGNGTSEGEV